MKNRIRTAFDKGSSTYDHFAVAQQYSSKLLVKATVDFFPCPDFSAGILDLGAGTGLVTQQMLKYFPKANYVLNDLSPLMLSVARSKLGNDFIFEVADMETKTYTNYSLILSNLSFQWLENIEQFLSKLSSTTAKLAFSSLLEGSFDEFYQLIYGGTTKIYPSASELKAFCMRTKPRKSLFFEKTLHLKFSSILLSIKYLQAIGAHTKLFNNNQIRLIHLIKTHKLPVNLTYKIFFAILEYR